MFDIELNPKPKAYYMKSFFKPEEPVVHIGVIDKKGDMMWNGVQTGNDGMSDHWNRVEGQTLSLVTYTNAEEVELVLNGKSLGKKHTIIFSSHVLSEVSAVCDRIVMINNGRIVADAKTEKF